MPTKPISTACASRSPAARPASGWRSCEPLAARGADVAFVARTASAVQRTAAPLGAHGIVGDVGRKEDIYPIALQITRRSAASTC